MDEVQIYRKQGLAVVTVHLKGEKQFQQYTEDYEIYVRHKNSQRPEWFTLRFPIPKRIMRETDLSKIEDLVFEIDCKNYEAKIRFNPKHIYIREKAESEAKISAYYRNKRDREEAKKQLAKAAKRKDSRYTNYSETNIDKPFQGGTCSPR